MPNNDQTTGRCPHDACEHMFVGASVDQVGEHFLKHTPFETNHELAGAAALCLMDFRWETDE